jgi:hypothetical protein
MVDVTGVASTMVPHLHDLTDNLGDGEARHSTHRAGA